MLVAPDVSGHDQADGKVAFADIPVFGVCRPACHGSSLYLFVLVLFHEAVVLSQVHVAWDIFYQHIVHVYRGVVYNHHLCLHLKTHSSTFIGFSCSICCSCCGVSVHRNISSAKRRLERNSPSIFTPLFSQFNLLNMLSNVAWVRWCPLSYFLWSHISPHYSMWSLRVSFSIISLRFFIRALVGDDIFGFAQCTLLDHFSHVLI